MRIRSTHGRRQPAALSAVVSCALAILSAKAEAGEKDLYVSLHYELEASSRGCWDEAKFRRGVTHRLGYDPFKKEAPLDLRVHIGGNALAVDGRLEWRDASGAGLGERTFVAKDGNCGKLMTEMSFAVGLQIEFLRMKPPKSGAANADVPASPPAIVPAPGSPSSPDVSPVETPPASEVPAPASDQTTPPPAPATQAAPKPDPVEKRLPEAPPAEAVASPSEPSAPWSLWVGLGPALAWRLSPGLTADGRLFLGLGRRNLSFEMAAEATYPSTFRREDGSGFRQTLIGATLAICGHIDWFSACALGRASQVRIKGMGVDQPRKPNGFVGQAGARLAATLPLVGPWSLATHLDGLALLTASRVSLNQTQVWEMPHLGAVVGIDLLARFW